jgi:hypothetical protein
VAGIYVVEFVSLLLLVCHTSGFHASGLCTNDHISLEQSNEQDCLTGPSRSVQNKIRLCYRRVKYLHTSI